MEIKVNDVGPCKKRISVSIPKEELTEQFDQSYEQLCRTVVIPGFRRGRAPRRLVERRFGDEVKEEVREKMLAKGFKEAIEKSNLEPFGEPGFDKIEFDPEKEMSFEVTLEVWPTFEVKDYKGLELKKKPAEPTEDEINETIEHIRFRYAQLTPVDEPAREGDVVVCDYEVYVGDELIADDENAELAATGSNITGISAREAAKLLIGSKAGDEKKGKFTVTDAFPQERWRNKEADVKFVIKEVKRPEKPKLDEQFVKGLGYDSVKKFKEAVKDDLQRRKEAWVQADLERQMADLLLKKFEFDLPQDIVERQAESNLRRQQIRLLLSGVTRDELAKERERMRTASKESSARDLKMFILLQRIADAEKIYVTENELEERIAAIAYQRETTPDKLKQRLEKEGTLSVLRRQMRDEKTMKFLLDNAHIAEEKASAAQQSAPSGKKK